MGGRIYTEEQIAWIKEHRNDYPNPHHMVRDFNSLFNESRSLESISNLCRQKKLVKSNFKRLSDTWHVGETKVMKNGLKATIIRWGGYGDIDAEFENGILREHVSYVSFKDGNLSTKQTISFAEFVKLHLHEKKMMNCGFECEITAIRSHRDIDVRWCDFKEEYTCNTQYMRFVKGTIRIPVKLKWLHQKARMNCGLMAEITGFVSVFDITVTFEDGYVTKSTTASWTHRTVDNPNASKKLIRRSRIGERRMMHSGLWCTITDYRGINDIDVMFDDNVAKCGVSYTGFINNNIMHPYFTSGRYYTSEDFHGYILKGLVTRFEDDALYKVITPDGDKELIRISEILKKIA